MIPIDEAIQALREPERSLNERECREIANVLDRLRCEVEHLSQPQLFGAVVPPGFVLVPVAAPDSLMAHLTAYGSVFGLSERDAEAVRQQTARRWAEILKAVESAEVEL